MRYINVNRNSIVIILPLLMSLISLKVSAQYDVAFSHYYAMPTSFNPAAAGKDTKLNLNLAYAMDMVGFEHNPQTARIKRTCYGKRNG